MGEPTAMLLPTYVAPKYKGWQNCPPCRFADGLAIHDDDDERGCPLCDEGWAIEWAIAEFTRQNNIERGEEDG